MYAANIVPNASSITGVYQMYALKRLAFERMHLVYACILQ